MNKNSDIDADMQWFTESELPYAEKDIKISVKVDSVVFDEQSDFGHVQVLDTPFFGRILVMDGIIQTSIDDEFIYHEMMVTMPAITHGSPKSVLVIGGGDGGAAKHALAIKGVEKIVMVEIDDTVIKVCEQYMPSIADGSLQNDKVELIVGDGKEFVKHCKDKFDVIALDVTDPVPGGPAEDLLSPEFYQDVYNLLNDDGVMATHCGSLIFQAKKSKLIADRLKKIFDTVTLHIALIPTFELTEFGFLMCTKGKPETSQENINIRFENLLNKPCQYISPEIYSSSAIVSPYITKLTGIKNS